MLEFLRVLKRQQRIEEVEKECWKRSPQPAQLEMNLKRAPCTPKHRISQNVCQDKMMMG